MSVDKAGPSYDCIVLGAGGVGSAALYHLARAGAHALGIDHRGDANADGGEDLSDAVFVLGYLFLSGAAPGCLETADIDGDGKVDLTDPVFLLQYLFLSGSPPALPGPSSAGPCGPDPDLPGSPGDLGCLIFPSCS